MNARALGAVVALLVSASTPPEAVATEPELEFEAVLRQVEEMSRCFDDPVCRAELDAKEAAEREAARQQQKAARQQQKEAAERMQAERAAVAEAAGRPVGTISLGDTPEYVRSQWGVPRDIDRMIRSSGTTEWWWYGGNVAVHFADGRVDSIHTGGRAP